MYHILEDALYAINFRDAENSNSPKIRSRLDPENRPIYISQMGASGLYDVYVVTVANDNTRAQICTFPYPVASVAKIRFDQYNMPLDSELRPGQVRIFDRETFTDVTPINTLKFRQHRVKILP